MVLLFRRFRRQRTPEPVEAPPDAPEAEEEVAGSDTEAPAADGEPDGPVPDEEEVSAEPAAGGSEAPLAEPDIDSGAAGPIPAPEPTFPSAPPSPPPPAPVQPESPAPVDRVGPVPAAQPDPALSTGGPPPLPASDDSLGPAGEPRGLSSPPANCFLCGTRLEDGRCPKCQMTWVE